MKKIIAHILSVLAVITVFHSAKLNAQAFFDFESGLVSTGYNDVRVPGDQGSLFSLKNDLIAAPKVFYRLKAGYKINSRHSISILFAPLQKRSEGNIPKDIIFMKTVFPANNDIDAIYKFNSYRLTYRYDFVQKQNFEFGLGFTAKIRDARIALTSSALFDEKVNVGFVPIINFRLFWRLNNNFGMLLEGDALAAKQGRAEDVLLAATYDFSDHFALKAGYRILEGGADNSTVYSFALFHYASFGFLVSF